MVYVRAKITCDYCQKEFLVPQYRQETAKFCRLACFKAYRTENGFAPYQRKEKICPRCGEAFIPSGGQSLFCSKADCQRALPFRVKFRNKRRIERQEVQQAWGRVVIKGSMSGRQAEEKAKDMLETLGFTEIFEYWRLSKTAFADLIATRDGIKYAVQVTSRIHTSNRWRPLLEVLNLKYCVLFVRSDLKFSVLKIPTGKSCALSQEDLKGGDIL